MVYEQIRWLAGGSREEPFFTADVGVNSAFKLANHLVLYHNEGMYQRTEGRFAAPKILCMFVFNGSMI